MNTLTNCVLINATIEEDVTLRHFTNLYGCTIKRGTKIGAFTEIGAGVTVGNDCKIGAYVFIPPGITIGNEVFIGPGVVFTNDKHPKATGNWECLTTVVGDGASIGAGSIIMPGITIGVDAVIGAGTLVLRDVAPGEIYVNRRLK